MMSATMRSHATRSGPVDEHGARELVLFIENDRDLQVRQAQYIIKNLATKKVRSKYEHEPAVKAFGYLVDAGAKKYAKEFGGTWHQLFNANTRRAAAEELVRDFEAEFELGNYDHLLPKKYQKEMMGVGGKVRFPSKGHAAKKTAWRLPSGLRISWSPVNQAYLALWPASKPVERQQVLKIGDANEIDSWLRETYGPEYGRAHHATKAARHQQLHDPRALRSASNRQLRAFYRDEQRDVAKARAEGKRRGLALHARKKSPAQLQREIDQALHYRGRR